MIEVFKILTDKYDTSVTFNFEETSRLWNRGAQFKASQP